MLLKVVFIFILFIFYFIFYLFILVFNFYFYFYYLIFNCFNSIFLFSIFGLYHFYFLYFSTLDLFLYSFLYFYIIIFLSFYFLFFILFFYKLLTQKRTWNSRWSGDEARRWAWSSSRLQIRSSDELHTGVFGSFTWLAKSTVGWVSRHRRRPPAARLYGPEIRSSPAGGDVRRGAGAPRGGHRSEVAAPAVNRPGDNRWHPLVFEFSPLDGPVLPCDSRR